MRAGQRVVVVASWSSFCGMRGKVMQVSPHLMVHLDGDAFPMRFGDREVAPDESGQVSMTGCE